MSDVNLVVYYIFIDCLMRKTVQLKGNNEEKIIYKIN